MRQCEAVEGNEKCTEEATHTGTVLTMKDGVVEVLACERHSKRKGFFGEKLKEATIS